MIVNRIYGALYVQFEAIRFGRGCIFFLLSMLLLVSCQPPTIEAQIEDLLLEPDAQQRTEIAVALADSLDLHPVELLSGLSGMESRRKAGRVKQALEDMLFRYSAITRSGDSVASQKAIECVRSITEPNYTDQSLSNDLKIELIIEVLRLTKSESDFQATIIESAVQYGEHGMIEMIKAWSKYQNSTGILKAITAFGDSAIDYLIVDLGKEKNVETLLAQIGESAASALIAKMESADQDVRFAAADALVKMRKRHPNSLVHLTNAIDNSSTGVIAKNHPFYIRLGQAGTEKLLIKALRNNFSKNMCLDYLNCGSEQLEDAATSIAHENGYFVLPDFGGHYGPKWGSGN